MCLIIYNPYFEKKNIARYQFYFDWREYCTFREKKNVDNFLWMAFFMLNEISWFARTRSYTPAKFVYVYQQCAIFVFRHATLHTIGIREDVHAVDVLQRPAKPCDDANPSAD
jgi:hypothetical protein